MAEKEIKAAIREKFEKKKETVLARAQKEADDILLEGNTRVQSLRELYIKELEKRFEAEKQRKLSEMSLSARAEILTEKEKVFEYIIDGVVSRLKHIRENPEEYRKTMRFLILESKESFPDAEHLRFRVLDEDAEPCKTIVNELGLNAVMSAGSCGEAAPCGYGGVIVSDLNETRICDNTLSSRLKRLITELRTEFYKFWL